MQWTPNARPQEQRRPYRDVLDALQERVRPFIERQPEFARPAYGSVLQSGADMLPGVGDVVGVEDLQAAARDGDPVGIGLGLLAAIPGIPAIGRGVRGGTGAARRAGGLIADAAPASRDLTDAESALARYRAVNPDDTGARVLNPGDEGYPTNAQWDQASQAYVAPVEPDYPIRAFHGSPHSFDQFELSPRTIGTGEGAQAYGHGIYLTETEDVARGYRDKLTFAAVDTPTSQGAAMRALSMHETPEAAIASLEANLRDSMQGLEVQRARGRSDLVANYENMQRTYADAIDMVRNGRVNPQGVMYEVGVNASPETFLDWDAPLSRQPEPVRRALGLGEPFDMDASVAELTRLANERGVPMHELPEYAEAERRMDAAIGSARNPDITGAEYYRGSDTDMLHTSPADFVSSEAGRSQALRDLGVNGIRYLDGISRGAGQGTSNYVVFNDELVKILRKYGISGLGLTGGAALGGGLLGSPQDQQAQPTTF